jgi:diguanylate cyclase (GGDEF)-like protein
MKILIADRALDAKEVLGTILQEEGYQCLFVKNSCEIIDKIYQELPQVIILDNRQHKHGCFDIVKKLKSAPSTRDIPVILSSSQRDPVTLAKGYQLGAYDYIFRPYFREEILARICNITYAAQRVKALENQLNRDYLTGLYNRRFFMEKFVEEATWSMRYKEPVSIMLLDIDHFKKVNDTYGHSCGDEILKQVAQIAATVSKPEHIAARYGGEEFIILLPNISRDGATEIAEKIRSSIQNKDFSCVCDNNTVHLSITISIGVTTYDSSTQVTPDQLIGQADNALYAAKEAGRNRVIVHTCDEQISEAYAS